jgi:hypothetical protein
MLEIRKEKEGGGQVEAWKAGRWDEKFRPLIFV